MYSVFTSDNTGNTAEPATVSARTAAVLDPIQVTSLLQVPVGSAVRVDLPTVTNVSQIEVGTSPAGVSWSTSGGALWVSVAMTSALGPSTARLGGIGCIAEVCDLKLAITVDVTVIGVEAPASAILDELTLPSSGRVSTAQLLPAGAGSNLVDEVTVVLGTADAPGARSAADAVAAAVDAVVAGGLERLGIYQLRWYTGQDIDARIVEILAIPGVAGVDRGLILTDPTTALPDGDWDDDAMDGTWHLRQMRAPEAWDVTSSTFRDPAAGSSVVVGIVDGGLVARHSDLNSARWVSIGAGVIGDHATHVAGLACARQNGSGVVGAAWGCPILSDAAIWPGFDDDRENEPSAFRPL